ncbi:MAG: universal stress protein [Burkholderiaceae bacterium]|nr:universal stress protein [Burkholderiaceae bacterium]
MKILVGIDGSKNALRALRFAIRLLRRIEGRHRSIVMLSVHDDTALRAASHFVGNEAVDDYLSDLSQADLAPAIALAAKSGLNYEAIEGRGPLASTIFDTAKAGKCDLIVLGSKGRSGIKDLLLGSVAQRVAAISNVPVTLVR